MAPCNLVEGKSDVEMPVSIQDLFELTQAAQNIRPSGNKVEVLQVYHIWALKQNMNVQECVHLRACWKHLSNIRTGLNLVFESSIR